MIQLIAQLMERDLEQLASELKDTNEDLLWTFPTGISNSIGNLSLHICGNLRHFIGHLVGKSEYVRDRDAEFSSRDLSKDELLGIIDATIPEVKTALSGLDPEILDTQFPQNLGKHNFNHRDALIYLCAHLSYHLGQVNYLRRILNER